VHARTYSGKPPVPVVPLVTFHSSLVPGVDARRREDPDPRFRTDFARLTLGDLLVVPPCLNLAEQPHRRRNRRCYRRPCPSPARADSKAEHTPCTPGVASWAKKKRPVSRRRQGGYGIVSRLGESNAAFWEKSGRQLRAQRAEPRRRAPFWIRIIGGTMFYPRSRILGTGRVRSGAEHLRSRRGRTFARGRRSASRIRSIPMRRVTRRDAVVPTTYFTSWQGVCF
jgi:hypothetical protein